MNHKDFAEHTDHYTINGRSYSVTANYVANLIIIKGGNFHQKVDMEEYMNFVGDMREFAEHTIGAS